MAVKSPPALSREKEKRSLCPILIPSPAIAGEGLTPYCALAFD
jgi:hypothetical protein